MPKNDFLSRQKEWEHAAFEGGIRVGRQQMCDFLTLALRDPEAMGKNTFSGKRILKVLNRIEELMTKFSPAFEKHDEADYYQSMLDRLLRQAYGDEIREGFYGFSDRYDVKKFDYQTGKWR